MADEICNQVYVEIINTVLHNTKSYVETVIAYLIAVYIDTQLGPDTDDIPDNQYKDIKNEVFEVVNTLGLRNPDKAKLYINESLIKISNQIELLENQ